LCSDEIIHQPVLCSAVLDNLHYGPNAVVVDATVGQAGHAVALAGRLEKNGLLIGLDVDSRSLQTAHRRLQQVDCQVKLLPENFARLDDVLAELGIEQVDVILADLGVSSAQLADPQRGFSFQLDGPLDMRLDSRREVTAADLVNKLPERQLADLIFRWGEEHASRRIARAIVARRREKPLTTTAELAQVVLKALHITGPGRKSRIHPATRTFQALRIAVNDELAGLQRLLKIAPSLLKKGGQIAIISFHSLEDRLVKNDFRQNKQADCYEIVTRKPIVADEDQRRENPRSRSAKLRIAMKK